MCQTWKIRQPSVSVPVKWRIANQLMTVISGKTLISQGLTVHLPTNLPTYWFIFEGKMYSKGSVGGTFARFKEHFDIVPLKNEIMKLFWAGKETKKTLNEQSRRMHFPLSAVQYLCSVSFQRSHWPDIFNQYQRYWFWSHFLVILIFFLFCNKTFESGLFFWLSKVSFESKFA